MIDRVNAHADRPGDTGDTGIFKRISWGAIIAGALVALAVQVMLWLLGAGIGLAAISPTEGEGSPQTLSIGAAIWWIIATLIALFVGGWIAAHLAGVSRKIDGALHGLVSWSLATVLALAMMGTTLSALGGFAAGTRQGQQGLAALGPQISQSYQQEARVERVRDRITNEAKQLVQQGGKATGDKLKDAQDKVADAVSEVLDDPSQDNRQSAIQALTENTKLNQQQASSRINQWSQTFKQAKPEYREAGTERARKAEKATSIAAGTAIASFIMLALGAAAALIGGYVGSPSDYWAMSHDRGEQAERKN